MQTSSIIISVQNTHHRFMFVMFTLCMFAMTSIWMMQNSINAYYQQTYHQDSPLKALDDYAVWQIGGEIGDWLYVQKDTITTWIDKQNNAVIDAYNANRQFPLQFAKRHNHQVLLKGYLDGRFVGNTH